MNKTHKLVLFGTGAFAEVAYCYFQEDSKYEVVAFTADKDYCKEPEVLGLPLIPFDELEGRFPPSDVEMHITVGYSKRNSIRQEAYERCKAKGYTLANYIHSGVHTWSSNAFGDNVFIFEDNTIQPFVKFGSNIVLWSGNHIGHHSIVEDAVFISSHVVVSGHCRIGAFSFLGVNSTLRDGITIAPETTLGAGCLIVKDTEHGKTYIGQKSVAYEKK